MNYLIGGASGFLGTALQNYLRDAGHCVKVLVRRKPQAPHEIEWNPAVLELPSHTLDDIDVVINLSGANIGDSLWTAKFKQELYESRIKPTRTIVRAISSSSKRKRLFFSASGVGIYGSHPSGEMDESRVEERGFFPLLAQHWEEEALKAASEDTRVVLARFGVILDPSGGALKKAEPVFKSGLVGIPGTGSQVMAWVSLEDVLRVVDFVSNTESVSGPINVVSPLRTTAADFTHALAAYHRTSVKFRIPALILETILGEMARETILANQHVIPAKLTAAGFQFKRKAVSQVF